jgi:hypothetical protein
VQAVYNFGREDDADREVLQRLAASVTRFLDPDLALAAPVGGLSAGPGCSTPCGRGSAERVLFAQIANRALVPSSKLAASPRISENVLVTGLSAVASTCSVPPTQDDRQRP